MRTRTPAEYYGVWVQIRHDYIFPIIGKDVLIERHGRHAARTGGPVMRIAHQRAERPFIQTTAAERQGGYVLVMFAMLLIPILLFVGFSVDVGSWYSRASDMQKAADAASLAGVVWLPDLDKARDVAKETAKKNGFDDAHPDIDVIVAQSESVANRLQVSIRDRSVGSFFYTSLGGEDLDMSRRSYAEYVTPVPMGSPRNYFGTGTLLRDHDVEDAFEVRKSSTWRQAATGPISSGRSSHRPLHHVQTSGRPRRTPGTTTTDPKAAAVPSRRRLGDPPTSRSDCGTAPQRGPSAGDPFRSHDLCATTHRPPWPYDPRRRRGR